MRTRNIVLWIFMIFVFVCFGYVKSALSISHPANNYFNSLDYPRVGINQITTRKLRDNPGVINSIAKTDMVIINKSDDLFVDKEASSNYARQLKALNPNIKVIQYLSISDIWSYQDTFKNWIPSHPGALLTDPNGNYIHPYANQYGNKRFMVDSTNPVWQDYFAQRMKKITDQGMDGVFIDNTWNSNWQGLNISPAKFSQIQQGWEITMQKGRALIGPDKIIISNSPPNPLFQTRDIAMLEGRLSPNKTSLNQYFAMSKQANSYGQLVFDTVKYGAYNGANFSYVLNFFLPAVLMTDNIWGNSVESTQWLDLLNRLGRIGKPLAPAGRANGILSRDYTGGKALLNDTASPVTINLPPNVYTKIDGTPVNSVSLNSMQGIVLKKI